MKKIIDKYDKNKFIQKEDKLIRAVGGDGTLLRAIKHFRHNNPKNLPYYGIAQGTVNFLMNDRQQPSASNSCFTQEPLETSQIVSLHLIKVSLYIDGTWKYYQAFNEVTIGAYNGWIKFDCSHSDDILGKIQGASLIVSTAQGSTGLNKNSGGAILPLSSSDWSVVGNQCTRRIDYVLAPKKIDIHATARHPINLTIDGEVIDLDRDIRIRISQGDYVNVIFDDYSKFKRKRR